MLQPNLQMPQHSRESPDAIPGSKMTPHLLLAPAFQPSRACPDAGSRNFKIEGARTQRTLSRGTAKRLLHKHAKPRPIGRVLGGLCNGLGKFAVFGTARSRSYAKYVS